MWNTENLRPGMQERVRPPFFLQARRNQAPRKMEMMQCNIQNLYWNTYLCFKFSLMASFHLGDFPPGLC